MGSDKLIEWLMAHGIRPMIAHPERNKDIMRDLAKLEPFVEAGCLLQLTADAIAGSFGAEAKQCARCILERGWATVMASDAHDSKLRPPRLHKGLAAAAKLVGEAAARALVEDIPRRIVEQE